MFYIFCFCFHFENITVNTLSFLSRFSRYCLFLLLTNESMNNLIELFDRFQQDIIQKQKLFDTEREDIQHSINETFNRIFAQLIEIRRYCRNDIEKQTINAQVCFSVNSKHSFPKMFNKKTKYLCQVLSFESNQQFVSI